MHTPPPIVYGDYQANALDPFHACFFFDDFLSLFHAAFP